MDGVGESSESGNGVSSSQSKKNGSFGEDDSDRSPKQVSPVRGGGSRNTSPLGRVGSRNTSPSRQKVTLRIVLTF
nr:f-box/kelch-repeat protein [Quercus suber]